MKHFSIGLNVVLIIAVGVLYYLHFSSQAPGSISTGPAMPNATAQNKILFVNIDSLFNNYDYFTDQSKVFDAKRTELEADYQNRATGLQREIDQFKKTAGSMTVNQARGREAELMQKQQQLLRFQEQLGNELAQFESSTSTEMQTRVAEYLRRYGLANEATYILSYADRGSSVLFANSGLDITHQVVDALNAEYQNQGGQGAGAGLPADSVQKP